MKTRIIAMTALASTLALVAGVVADTHLKLKHLRASSDAAWSEVAAIHAQRIVLAKAALISVTATADPQLLRRLDDQLQRSAAMPASSAMLDDPVAIDAYKQRQGELTGALFMLAAGTSPSAQLAQLRAQLPRDEEALADARERYRVASAAFNARNSGALASLLRYRPLAATL
ncbi:MAG TPA: hypothetical protein VFS95_05425 [Telluria sp.]|nr:hypothetical protein [Telluria sp.]